MTTDDFESLLEGYPYIFKKGELVKGTPISHEGGRVLVDIGAKAPAIIPEREVSNNPDASANELLPVGEEKEFLIVGNENDENQFMLSYKKVETAYTWEKLLKLKEEDAIIEGEVASVVKGGILVNVMGLRAFVPSSHVRGKELDELVGKNIELKILSVDPAQNNLIMSHKKVTTDSYRKEHREELFDELRLGDELEGEIVRIADFGAFVDVGGVDGLLPLSQISWKWVDHPSDVLKLGQKVRVEIISIEEDKRRVSLSMKTLEADPWENAAASIAEGDKVKGKITRLKAFGAFVEIQDGVEALLPQREVEDYEHEEGKQLQQNDEIEAFVARFRPEEKRISLSLSDEPAEYYD